MTAASKGVGVGVTSVKSWMTYTLGLTEITRFENLEMDREGGPDGPFCRGMEGAGTFCNVRRTVMSAQANVVQVRSDLVIVTRHSTS